MKKIALVGLVIVLGSTSAWADEWNRISQNLVDSLNTETSQQQQSQLDNETARDSFQKSAGKLAAKLKKEQDQQARVQKDLEALNQKQSDIDFEITKEQTLASKRKVFIFTKKNKAEKVVEQDRKQIPQIQLEIDQQKAKLAALKTQIEADAKQQQRDLDSATTANSRVMAAMNTLSSMKSPTAQQRNAQTVVSTLFKAKEQSALNSKFLLMNLQVAQQQNKLNDVQMNVIKQQADLQLNNTMLGEYVSQALLSTCDPAFQNACAAKDANAINELIKQKLTAAQNEAATAVSSSAQKATAASAAGAAAAKPAGANVAK